MYNIYCELRDKRKIKDSDVSKATGITKSTFSDWKSGRSKPKNDKLQKIADYFNVSLEYLTTGKEDTSLPDFTEKNERDIKNSLEAIKNQLSTGTGLMYDGEPIDEESQRAILAAVEVAERTAILEARKKYTPKKYKK